MLGNHSFFYVLLSASITSLAFHYNMGAVTNYLPDAQKVDGGNEKVSVK
jgi:hypothetical protein